MKHLVIAAILLCSIGLASCGNKQPQKGKVITEGNFTIEVNEAEPVMTLYVKHTDGRDFAFAVLPSSQSDPALVDMVTFPLGADAYLKNINAAQNLYLYEYVATPEGFKKLKNTVTLAHVVTKFQE